MYTYDFEFSDHVIRLECVREIEVNQAFKPFLVNDCQPDCTISFREKESLCFPTGDPIGAGVSFSVYASDGAFVRCFHDDMNGGRPYAVGRINADGASETVEYLADSRAFFSETQNSFSHIALEELLMHRDRLIFHASFISSPWGGLLFSGISGIGKSTQADLWAANEDSEIINGDRPILGKADGTWCAWGSPYAGSSGYHVRKNCRSRQLPF